jgi:acetyltransferase
MSAPAQITIRRLQAGDDRALGFLLSHLSDQSRYLRFHSASADLARETRRLAGADHWHHEVLLALASAPRVPIGVVEYVRTERFDRAELAIAIADHWQRHGVGLLLIDQLRAQARAAGVRHLLAWVVADNQAALALARRCDPGAQVSFDLHRGEVMLDLHP